MGSSTLNNTTASVTAEVTGIGSLTETAPANDTASSGLNGRLQRIAQNITTLIAQLTTERPITTLLDAVISVSTGTPTAIPKGEITAQAKVVGTGAVTATVELWGTLDPLLTGVLLATFTLSGTTSAQDAGPLGNDFIPKYPYVYGKLTAISGTNSEAFLEVAV